MESSLARALFSRSSSFTPGEFASRRHSLISLLSQTIPHASSGSRSPSIIVLPSNRLLYETYPGPIFRSFIQNRNLVYLMGVKESSTGGGLQPNKHVTVIETLKRLTNQSQSHRVIMFIDDKEEYNSYEALWTGPPLTETMCKTEFGADLVYNLNSLDEYLQEQLMLKPGSMTQYAASGTLSAATIWIDKDSIESGMDILSHDQRRMLLEHGQDFAPFIQKLRLIKSPAEQQVMRQAGHIGAMALKNTLEEIHSQGLLEESQIAVQHAWQVKRQEPNARVAYTPVIASGPRACILHYTHNSLRRNPNDLLLIDAGACFEGYFSDITRTVSIGQAMTPAQTDLYKILYEVQAGCLDLIHRACTKHNTKETTLSLDQLHRYSVDQMVRLLKALKIAPDANDKQLIQLIETRLYPHHVGHYLGLDLHDCPLVPTSIPLKPAMTFTVEPGLYIPPNDPTFDSRYWGIGIRLEDDVLFREDGRLEIFSKDCPKQPVPN